jgi:hypothetical protein
MIALLLLAVGRAQAQSASSAGSGAMDSDVTIVGKDETAIPVPPPRSQQEVTLPEPDMTPLDPVTLPAIPPPIDTVSVPGDDFPVVDDAGEPLP